MYGKPRNIWGTTHQVPLNKLEIEMIADMMIVAIDNIFESDFDEEFDIAIIVNSDEYEDHEDAIRLLTCHSVICKLYAALAEDSTRPDEVV